MRGARDQLHRTPDDSCLAVAGRDPGAVRKGHGVNNKWVLATIVGQAVVTLVAIGYGVSAHSSWETERQRRLDSERAAVAEMATAMKAAGERLDKVEQELRRCRIRARRRAQSPLVGPVGARPVSSLLVAYSTGPRPHRASACAAVNSPLL